VPVPDPTCEARKCASVRRYAGDSIVAESTMKSSAGRRSFDITIPPVNLDSPLS
jgi:hypothetical protein